MKDLRETKRS